MVMTEAEIMYAISTGDSPKEEKMRLLKLQVCDIRTSERRRISKRLLDYKDEELEEDK